MRVTALPILVTIKVTLAQPLISAESAADQLGPGFTGETGDQRLAAGHRGREIAAAHCVSCHDASRLVTPGYNRTGWEDVIERMRKLGVVVSADEQSVLTDYLAHNFPPQPQAATTPPAGTVAGPMPSG